MRTRCGRTRCGRPFQPRSSVRACRISQTLRVSGGFNDFARVHVHTATRSCTRAKMCRSVTRLEEHFASLSGVPCVGNISASMLFSTGSKDVSVTICSRVWPLLLRQFTNARPAPVRGRRFGPRDGRCAPPRKRPWAGTKSTTGASGQRAPLHTAVKSWGPYWYQNLDEIWTRACMIRFISKVLLLTANISGSVSFIPDVSMLSTNPGFRPEMRTAAAGRRRR